jgi:hypothetical protein
MSIRTRFPPLPFVARYNPVSSSTYPFDSANSLNLCAINIELTLEKGTFPFFFFFLGGGGLGVKRIRV